VTLLDANHCPGAAMMLFELPDGRAYLHVGDFRWGRHMRRFAPLARFAAGDGGAVRRLDALFLDTTYADPAYAFPPQEACVAAVVRTAVAAAAADPSALLLFGSYTIGKERVFMEVARALDERVYVDGTKYRTLLALGWPVGDVARLTTDPTAARIHVVPMGYLTMPRLAARLTAQWRAAGVVLAPPSFLPPPPVSNPASAASTPARKQPPAPTTTTFRKSVGRRGSQFAALLAASAAEAPAAIAAVMAGGAPRSSMMDAVRSPPPPASGAAPTNAFTALMARAAANARGGGPAAQATAPQAGRRQPARTILAFRPTGWAHNPTGGARGMAPVGDDGDPLQFVDVATRIDVDGGGGGGGGWTRAGDADNLALPVLPAAAAAADAGGTAAADFHETRRARAVHTAVFVPDGGGGAPVGGTAPAPAPPAIALGLPGPAAGGRVVHVRMTKQVRTISAAGTGITAPAPPPPSAATTAAAAAGAATAAPPTTCTITLYSVPYSEHSSFDELRDCVAWLDPARIIPTVNCRSQADADYLVSLLRGPAATPAAGLPGGALAPAFP